MMCKAGVMFSTRLAKLAFRWLGLLLTIWDKVSQISTLSPCMSWQFLKRFPQFLPWPAHYTWMVSVLKWEFWSDVFIVSTCKLLIGLLCLLWPIKTQGIWSMLDSVINYSAVLLEYSYCVFGFSSLFSWPETLLWVPRILASIENRPDAYSPQSRAGGHFRDVSETWHSWNVAQPCPVEFKSYSFTMYWRWKSYIHGAHGVERGAQYVC